LCHLLFERMTVHVFFLQHEEFFEIEVWMKFLLSDKLELLVGPDLVLNSLFEFLLSTESGFLMNDVYYFLVSSVL
jgi:hypothetical protein